MRFSVLFPRPFGCGDLDPVSFEREARRRGDDARRCERERERRGERERRPRDEEKPSPFPAAPRCDGDGERRTEGGRRRRWEEERPAKCEQLVCGRVGVLR